MRINLSMGFLGVVAVGCLVVIAIAAGALAGWWL
jgi:hypothetical protein